MNSLITVQSFFSRIEADIAKGLLTANGIQSIVCADDAGGSRPFPMAYTSGVELKVQNEDVARAKQLLKVKKMVK